MRYTPDAILDPSQVEVIAPLHTLAPSMVMVILAALFILILMGIEGPGAPAGHLPIGSGGS